MTSGSNALLLDTCALIWIAERSPLKPAVVSAVRAATLENSLFVSPVSAWEIGMLAAKQAGRQETPLFSSDAKSWFATFMAMRGVREASFTCEIAMDVSLLPGDLHNDPADRMLIATARNLDIPIVTGDRKIIAYGEQGLVKVLPC